MVNDNIGASASPTGLSSLRDGAADASPPKASIPSAEDTIRVGGRDVLRFHPTHKRIKDDIPRCISCGQIDEDGFHDPRWCPGIGGYLPFPTSTVKIALKTDSGFRSEITARLTLQQWELINMVIEADDRVARAIVDQNGEYVGTAHTPIADLLRVEAFKDESGSVWVPPTAWAYFSACRASREGDAQ